MLSTSTLRIAIGSSVPQANSVLGCFGVSQYVLPCVVASYNSKRVLRAPDIKPLVLRVAIGRLTLVNLSKALRGFKMRQHYFPEACSHILNNKSQKLHHNLFASCVFDGNYGAMWWRFHGDARKQQTTSATIMTGHESGLGRGGGGG